MRIFRGVLKVVAVFAFAACVNAAIIFALEPYGSKSEVMWTDYRQQENLDMVFIGTSLAERAFDPNYIDEQTGSNSYNMATPGQWIEESYLALQTAAEENDLDVVVFGFEYSDVQGDDFPDPGRAFLRNKNEGDLRGSLQDAVYCLSNERCYTEKSSINWLFPWISNHVKADPSAIVDNMRMKVDGTTVYDAALANERDWIYYGKGYGNYEKKLNYNKGSSRIYTDAYGREDFDQGKLEVLAAMCDYCRERGIDFLVVSPPIPVFNIFEYGSKYFVQSEQLRALVESHGGEYYDLNFARPELLDVSNTDYFADYQHLNAAGGEAVSRAFVQLMEMRESEGDLGSLFYSQDEYRQAMSYIDLVLLDAEVVGGGVLLKAEALAGAGVATEYQMCIWDAATETWAEIRGWSDTPDFLFEIEDSGTYKFRVNAREVGSGVEYDRYRVAKITV